MGSNIAPLTHTQIIARVYTSRRDGWIQGALLCVWTENNNTKQSLFTQQMVI